MDNILVHLHPDFSEELEKVLGKWNEVQSTLFFRGIRPPKEIEAVLLAPGSVALERTFTIAKEARSAAGFKSDDEIIVFTEKRIFEEPDYYQLYFGGSGNVATISLDFTRKLFKDSSPTENYVFRTLLSNIINYLGQRIGLESHDETEGCVLDFCNDMSDITKGIENGPSFCEGHLKEISCRRQSYLLNLIDVVANSAEIVKQDLEVSRRITSFNSPVEIGIVVALEEEFREVFEHIRTRAKPTFRNEINQYYYLFEGGGGAKPYRCVITFIGGMGPTKAALVGDRLIQEFKPATIINIGIAGSMDRDVSVGDIVIAEQVDEYLHSAKAIADTDSITFQFQLSGDPYKSSPDYVSHAKNLEYAYAKPTEQWHSRCADRLGELVAEDKRNELLQKRLIRNTPRILVGNIASGSIVGATEIFIRWLKENRDRKYLALEMESAGVMSAAHTRSTPNLVIRGISDYGDARKEALDQIDDGALRRYAMNNVITLLWTLMDLQLIRHFDDE
jgi:nucleoside phosphorylase/predicted Zn-dependent protease